MTLLFLKIVAMLRLLLIGLPSSLYFFQCILRLENKGTLWKMTKLNKNNILNIYNTNKTHVIMTH